MREGSCKRCAGPLYQIGTFRACQNVGCQLYAAPVFAETAESLAGFAWSGSVNDDLIAQGEREDADLEAEVTPEPMRRAS